MKLYELTAADIAAMIAETAMRIQEDDLDVDELDSALWEIKDSVDALENCINKKRSGK